MASLDVASLDDYTLFVAAAKAAVDDDIALSPGQKQAQDREIAPALDLHCHGTVSMTCVCDEPPIYTGDGEAGI